MIGLCLKFYQNMWNMNLKRKETQYITAVDKLFLYIKFVFETIS